ncbi:hypothetical protein [Pseudooceanicola sediminis]|uniref:hypothetical protein n=1 Tax=Pseudooceanicola sediminis TaxID=2211117 RepID=UPI001F34C34E|nr:hypothetical protein [Pseudooceanicola sediminis]
MRTTIETIERQVLGITEDLKALQDRVRAGEVEAVKETTKMCGEIRFWVRFALEMEAKLDEGKKRNGVSSTRGGGTGGGDIDLAAARASIGCRLDRLRRCGYAEVVSG